MRYYMAFVIAYTVYSSMACAADLIAWLHLAKARKELLNGVEKRYEEIPQQADFLQQSYFAGLDRSEGSSGSLRFKSLTDGLSQ